jgi:hypothetical protein
MIGLFKSKEFYNIFWQIQKNDLKDFYIPYKIVYLSLVPFSFICYCMHAYSIYIGPELAEYQKMLAEYQSE